MLHNDLRRIFLDAPSRPFKVFGPIAAVALCFCAVCISVLMEARRTAWEHSADAAASLVTAIESDLVRNIETLNVSLQSVAENLRQPEIARISPGLRQRVLFDQSAKARNMGAILVLDEAGKLRFSSHSAEPKPQDLSSRDYFKVHKSGKLEGGKPAALHIGRPKFANDTAQYFVGISRRLTNADGSFAGVVAGTMRLDYVQQLFKDLALGPHSTITLARADGTVIVRWPSSEPGGATLDRADLVRQFAKTRRGRFDAVSADDNAGHLVVYAHIGDLPLVLSIRQSNIDIYRAWRHYAWTVGLLLAILSALAGALAWLLLRELRRRTSIERRLATLASTDGLTGLSNRWHFDQTIGFEWRRAQRSHEPLALVMIDADLFKAYNDRHGHQAGDRLLKMVGGAIAGRIRAGTDLGARYGGDEFAVLLPGTSLAGAERIANQIRAKFVEDCSEDGAGEVGGISIGVACLLPEGAPDHTALLVAADRALYRAKRDGRNRTELAEGEFASALENARQALHRAA